MERTEEKKRPVCGEEASAEFFCGGAALPRIKRIENFSLFLYRNGLFFFKFLPFSRREFFAVAGFLRDLLGIKR
ncbi:MAG: hypothetical protein J6C26_07115, partial [Clostridia bacterium]|nr:hypothetical protein [Clostridia bacterium]